MFIEIIHDDQGNITECCAVYSLPAADGAPIFTKWFDELDAQGKPTGQKTDKLPAGRTQARINIDTLTAMEIDEASGLKAERDPQGNIVTDPATGEPVMRRVLQSDYIMKTFKVDVTGPDKTHIKPLKNIPAGMKVRGLVRK